MRTKDLTGRRYTKLKVFKFAEERLNSKGYPEPYWECLCDCGKTATVRGYDLTKLNTRSCGCLIRDTKTTHGYSRRRHQRKQHPLYSTWAGMIQRCTNPASISFQWYGGRGITVCDRWRKFANFLHDMGPSWIKGLWLEREDNTRGYCLDNCLWITPYEQQLNKLSNRYLTYNGSTRTITEWSRLLGGTDGLVRQRIKYGWTTEKALTTPPDSRFQ